ncbi:MAG: group 1 truncated hemoglobin [bacterium]|nr:group 1 truncated hemoglobin [bacterium]
MQPSLVEQAGGPEAIRAVLRDFYGHVFGDFMIGFLFKGADKERLIAKETELTLHALGADVAYTGRDVRQAHATHPIMGGHFMRRRKLLADAIARAALPDAVRDAWLAHTDSLRPDVTRDRTDECDAAGAHARLRGG